MTATATVIVGDARVALAGMEPASVHAIVTSPPYWRQRDYGHPDQLGQEPTADAYVDNLAGVLELAARALRPDGTLWLNLADTYHRGELAGIPWRVALELQRRGLRLRQDVIWHKPAPMPESVRDRCTRAHEYLFLFARERRYHFDALAIAEPATTGGTRHPRTVWRFPHAGYRGAHFATMPPALVRRCLEATVPALTCPACGKAYERIVARERIPTRPGARSKTYAAAGGARPGAETGNRDPRRHVTTTRTIGLAAGCDCASADAWPGAVLDPFAGAGTVAAVAAELGRSSVSVELNPDYAAQAVDRIRAAAPDYPVSISTQTDRP